MNLRDIAKKIGSYISSKTQDDEGWIRQNKFTPVKQVQQMGQNLSAWGNIANQGIKNQIDIQKRDFNQYLWKPLKENPVLTPTLNRFEQATPAIGNQLRQLNPFSPKQTPQQNWQDTKKIGAAALTAYGLAKAPFAAMMGGAVINPIVKLGTNVYQNKKGEQLNKQLSQIGQSRTDVPLFAQQKPYQQKKITEGVVNAIPEGAGTGLANAGTTRLTNYLVQSLSKTLPFLKPLTEEAIKKSAPVVTDTTKEAVKKVFDVGTKRLVKAAVIETAVESPIWATLTQTEQESYIEALTREAEENLIMNIGMAGVNILSDSKALIPIVKKSIDTAVQNYKDLPASQTQGGYIGLGGETIDGTQRTQRFGELLDQYYAKNATPEQRVNSFTEIRRMAGDIFSKKQIVELTTGKNNNPRVLIQAIGEKIDSDIQNNRGYKEPFTLKNLLNNKELQRGGMDLTDKTKPFPQSQISPESKGIIKLKDNDLVKTFNETIKIKPSEKIKVTGPELKQRGFSASVQQAPNVSKKVKLKVNGAYESKPNDVLMGEAKALLTQGGTIKDVKNVQNIDQKITAAMQEAINLDAQGQHEAAANLFNNLSDIGTELGRGVQSYSLLQKMSPQAIALSAAGKIKKYNQTAKVKIPVLTGQQQKVISDQVNNVINLPEGREKNIALNELENIINSFIPSSKTDKFLTVWKAGLLTSVRTHARNIVGNTIMQGSEMMSNVPGSFADRLMALRTGQRTLTPTLQGTLQGTKEGFSQAGDIMKYGFDPTETIQKFDIKKVNWGDTPTQKAMKAYTDFVFNSLSAEDKPFYQSSYVRSLYNQASAMAINAGKSGDAKYIKNLVDNATEQMKTIATNDANYATFKDKNALSKLASAFKQSTNGKWYTKLPAEIVAPFTQVPSSMVQKTFDYSPIGLFKGIKDTGKVLVQNVPDLQRQAAQEIGRGTIGTGIFALGSYLMAKGLMTGQPKDDAERKQWELEGKQQNSILINGKWRSINSVGPQTLILLAGAKYDEEMNDPEGSMAQYGIGLVQDQLNQTFLSGVQQPLQAITDPQRYGKSYVGGQVASFVPNIVKDTAKAFDPTARETDTGSMMGNIKTSVQSGIPAWRNQMTPKRDTLGNIMKQEPTGLGAYVDLFNSKTPISNTVIDELSRLNNAGYNATPSKLGTSQTISGIKVKLDQKSLDEYEETAGKAVSSALESLFASNSYQKLDDQSKQEAIDDVVSKERKKVRANMNLSWTPDMGYTKSADSPTGISRVGLYGKSVVTDPKQTIKAVLDGNPIRKVEGGAVILERKNSLGTLDQGNKATEVDHKIALTLGGTNKEDNLQVLTKEENRIKGAFETYLYKEMKAGRITKEEAQKRDLNWREEVGKIPQSEQTKIVEGLESEAVDTSSGKVYKLVSESGTVTTIDLSKAIEEPKLTGFTEVDKKLKSSYKSAITTRINNIVKLYEDGQLSAEEAEKYIKELKAKSTGTGSTKSKGGKITIKATKYDIPKISVKFQETPSTIKLKSAHKIKVSSSNQRRYTIKA